MDTNLAPLDRLRTPDLTEEVGRRMQIPPRPVPEPPRGVRRIAAAVVAFVVFAAAAGFAWTMFRDDDMPVPATDPWAWAPEGWTELEGGPGYRDGAAVVWSGSELFVWGGVSGDEGSPVRDDGASYDPATQTWTDLPAAPIGLHRAHGVWTGSELLLWGEYHPEQQTDVPKSDYATVLAYDPSARTWRTLPSSPHLPAWGGAWTWTGTELVVFGGGRTDDATAVSGAALDPAAGSWRELPEAPLPMNLANAAWASDEVVFLGAALDLGNHSTTPTAVALAYRPATDAWRVLPTPPLSPQASDITAVGGRIDRVGLRRRLGRVRRIGGSLAQRRADAARSRRVLRQRRGGRGHAVRVELRLSRRVVPEWGLARR